MKLRQMTTQQGFLEQGLVKLEATAGAMLKQNLDKAEEYISTLAENVVKAKADIQEGEQRASNIIAGMNEQIAKFEKDKQEKDAANTGSAEGELIAASDGCFGLGHNMVGPDEVHASNMYQKNARTLQGLSSAAELTKLCRRDGATARLCDLVASAPSVQSGAPLSQYSGHYRAFYMPDAPQTLASNTKTRSLGLHGPPVDSKMRSSQQTQNECCEECHRRTLLARQNHVFCASHAVGIRTTHQGSDAAC